MAIRKANKTPLIEELQQEREHIESLFADRINFYLVFAAGVLLFVFDKPHDAKLLKVALVIVIIVSVLMLVALLRTFLLVKAVLHEITTEHSEVPYSRYCEHLKLIPNANNLLFALPVAMTVFFIYALVHVWNC
jgi:hypothetical protein